MTTFRKAMPLLLFCAALLVCLPLSAQTQDCSFTYTFTGDGTQTAVSNLSGAIPCRNWAITLSTDAAAGGTLSSTVTFQTSPDKSTWTAVPSTICSPSVQPPCVLQGANPIVGTQGMLYAASYGAYVRVVISGSSGTGHGTVRGYGVKGASAAALPSSGSGGSGTVTNVATTSPITGGPITGSGTIGLDTTKVAQKFFGTSAPGSVATNLPGDLFTDTTAHNEYVCNATAGTGAPACTSVTAAGWLLLNGGGGGSGTVTTVGFTGGIISVATPTTTPAFTVAGTSGGIPYFSSASTWATSAALTANGVVLGGGAGAAPTVTAADSTVTHALFATAGAPAFRALASGDLPAIPLSGLATQAADTVVMNATAGSAVPTAVAMPVGCAGANLYNTSTHAWSCVSTGGTFTKDLGFGSDDGPPLVTTQIQPQRSLIVAPSTMAVSLILVKADAGASTIQLAYRHSTGGAPTTTAYTSAVLTPATVSNITGTVACANAAGTAITVDGISVTCGTLATQTWTAGDSIETIGGAADGTTKRISVHIEAQ